MAKKVILFLFLSLIFNQLRPWIVVNISGKPQRFIFAIPGEIGDFNISPNHIVEINGNISLLNEVYENRHHYDVAIITDEKVITHRITDEEEKWIDAEINKIEEELKTEAEKSDKNRKKIRDSYVDKVIKELGIDNRS